MISVIGSSEYSNTSGTGRSVCVTVEVVRPVRRSRSSMIPDMSPRVADMSRNWAPGRSSRGICQETPRCGSA